MHYLIFLLLITPPFNLTKATCKCSYNMVVELLLVDTGFKLDKIWNKIDIIFVSITESRAICRYITEKYSNKGTTGLYGTNPLVKASIDQWLEAESQSFNPSSSVLTFQLVFAPIMKLKQDESLIKQNEAKLVKVLDVYENRLGSSRYLAGDEFTLADLSHLPNTRFLVEKTDRAELFTSRKNVGRWWEEISSRPSWKKVVEMQNV